MKLFSKKTDTMHWESEAEEAVGKAPFFIRPKIKTKIEEFCRAEGSSKVTLDIVNRAKSSFTEEMHKNVKGYQISSCFSSSGCPNRIFSTENLLARLEEELKNADILGFLKSNIKDGLKFHHEFRLTIADCPNSCSQPQIADFGIIAASVPNVLGTNCTLCGECTSSCPDKAITLDHNSLIPIIDFSHCSKCGICCKKCGFGEIIEAKRGYRILLGGRLGRHPRLGMELSGIFSEAETLSIFKWSVDFYLRNSKDGKRFSHIFTDKDFQELTRKIDQDNFSS
ncbi:hypothetical protein [Desulforegula conservatrix]|uniref:hypothetical protein n=1 Tax=Desulforegula conservatrix TaxID=153026 RepID=UPI00041EB066|nr:hypothetical protein [Desulforegula conservatrix]